MHIGIATLHFGQCRPVAHHDLAARCIKFAKGLKVLFRGDAADIKQDRARQIGHFRQIGPVGVNCAWSIPRLHRRV
jgi:hypothetical protein